MSKESILFPGFFTREDKPAIAKNYATATSIRVGIPSGKTKEYIDLYNNLNESLTKDNLLRLINHLDKQIVNKSIVYTDKNGLDINLGALKSKYGMPFNSISNSLTKDTLLIMLMPLLLDYNVFSQWLDTFGSKVKNLWMEALHNFYLTSDQLVGYIFTKIRRYINPLHEHPSHAKVTPLLLLKTISEYYNWGVLKYEIPSKLAELQFRQMLESTPEPDYGKNDEAVRNLALFNGNDFVSTLNSLMLTLACTPPKFTQNGKLTKAYLKSIQRSYDINKFSDDKNDVWRIEIIIAALFNLIKNKKSNEDIYISLLNELKTINKDEIRAIYPNVSEINNIVVFHKVSTRLFSDSLQWLESIPEYKWGSTDDLFITCRRNLSSDLYMSHGEVYFGIMLNSDMADSGFGYVNFLFKGIPAGLLLYMAAFGMLEIAYNEIDGLNLYSHLYVRLTPLGRYAMGLSKDNPTDKEVVPDKYVEIDNINNTITLLGKNNPLTNLINECGDEIHPGQYRISPQKFISRCASLPELENKISHFTKFILNGDTDIFKKLFDQMRSRVERAHIATIGHYAIIQIDPNCGELQNLIESDDTIRAISLRVEGFRLLVPFNKISYFLNILKAHGFIPKETYQNNYWY